MPLAPRTRVDVRTRATASPPPWSILRETL